ncbi:ABC transporter substrate-binding protein [Leucobacter sp. PH1c]|uniref:ABC transporter substrate-binding protein n=1 Tax=Leucobacter sp. PH1c TaxID=1397278 RepID=UPI00046957AE|nr:ABC transporter substrate-binding protein [Leucobacter sp. PH1c]
MQSQRLRGQTASGFREWDIAFDADGAAEIPEAFARLRPYAERFRTLGVATLRFVLRDGDAWWRVALCAPGLAEHQAAAGQFAPVDRVSLALEYGPGAPGGLSNREIEIATLIAAGLADKEIAQRLGTSPRTVSTQISRLLMRHGLPTRSALAAVVADEGWALLPVPGEPLRDPVLPVFALDAAGRASSRHPRPFAEPSRAPRPTRAPLRIGLLVTDGSFADDGREAAHGAELALAQMTQMHRGAQGRPFEPVRIAIDPLSADSVAAGLARLASEDVDAILSTYASALAPEIFDFASDYHRPFLHTNSWTDSALRVAQDPTRFAHTFQTSPTERSYTSGLRAHLVRARETGQLGAPRVSIIELDGYGCSLSAGGIHEELDASGITVDATVGVGLTIGDADAIAAEALRTAPGLVIVSHLDVEVAIELQRALRRVSVETPVFHLYTPSIPRFFDELGDDGNGVIWSTTTGRTGDLLGQRFAEGYTRSFGRAPGWSQASAAFDQAQLLAQAFLFSGSRRADDVSDALRLMVHRGVNGTYALGTPGQTVAGYPFDSADATLTTRTVTYRYSGGRMSVLD